jgi:hypothetical protein
MLSESITCLLDIECVFLEPVIELQKSSVMANGGDMELANENKKESEVFTDIEPQGDGEVFVDEAFDSFLMRDALLYENENGINSWVSEAAIPAEDGLLRMIFRIFHPDNYV